MDARAVVPMWTDPVESTVWVERAEASQASTPFDPWQLPGEKMLLASGKTLSLIARWGSHSARWILSAELHVGDSFAYQLAADPSLATRLRNLQRLLAALDAARTAPANTFARPSRAALVHMRTLQALDGVLDGATQRDIACAVFGSAQVAARWHPDSDLRAQVRHLVRRGRRLMRGDYRQLLDGVEAGTGR